MTYIVSSDWHAHNWSQFSTTVDGINSRLTDILHEIERQAIDANTRGIKRIYVAGDVFHVRGSIKPTVFNPLADMLAKCVVNYGVEFRIMPGNHDLEGRDSERLSSAITQLGQISGVVVASEPTAFEDDMVLMIPWHDTRERLARAIDGMKSAFDHEMDPSEWDLILHTGINGVLIGMPDHGWSPEELATFGFKRVFSGHYHHHKVFMTEPHGESFPVQPIVSIGALTHQTWSDVGTAAGYIVVDCDSFEHVQSTAPRFVDFDFEEVEHVGPDVYQNCYVRVRGIELEESETREMRDAIMEHGAKGVVIDPLRKSETKRKITTSTAEAVRLEAQIKDYSDEMFGDLAGAINEEAQNILAEVQGAA